MSRILLTPIRPVFLSILMMLPFELGCLLSIPTDVHHRFFYLLFLFGNLLFLGLLSTVKRSEESNYAVQIFPRALFTYQLLFLLWYTFTPVRVPTILVPMLLIILCLPLGLSLLRKASPLILLKRYVKDGFVWGAILFTLTLFLARRFHYDHPWITSFLLKSRQIFAEGGSHYTLVDLFPDVDFNQPLEIRELPFEVGNYFVLERPGTLKFISSQGKSVESLNLTDIVVMEPASEDGAIGFTVHPKLGSPEDRDHDFLFLHYVIAKQGINHNRLSRFKIDRATHLVDRSSEQILMEQPHPLSGSHNGGGVMFGPDGLLYFSTGDYSGGEDSRHLSQTIDQGLFSGIFRIDVDCSKSKSHPIRVQPKAGYTKGYCIPNDNPFVGTAGALEEYWSLGLRNAYRFSFDPKNGDLWAGDVGQEMVEELNILKPGSNHQWSYLEGTVPFPHSRFKGVRPAQIIGVETPPVFTFLHSGVDRAVIGGQVYRGARFPELDGKYLFGEFATARLYMLQGMETGKPERVMISRPTSFRGSNAIGLTSVVVDQAGRVLVVLMGVPGKKGGGVLSLERATQTSSVAPPKISSPEEAKNLYAAYCLRCHGHEGSGKNDMGITPPPRNFQDPKWQSEVSDEKIEKVIREGGAAVGLSPVMPPWTAAMDSAQITEMRKLIRSFKR